MPDDVAILACADGYSSHPQYVYLICQVDGTWTSGMGSDRLPSCQRKYFINVHTNFCLQQLACPFLRGIVYRGLLDIAKCVLCVVCLCISKNGQT